MRMAKVLNATKIRKGHGHGFLNLAFDMQANVKKFEPGHRLTARVTHVRHHPLSVQFHMANGQQATLCATAIANNYEKVHQHIEHFKRDGIFHLYALRQEQNPQRNYVCAEGRYETYLKQKDTPIKTEELRRLLVDRSQATTGLVERKRMAEKDDTIVPKKEKREEESPEPAEKVLLSDPGFDWSNTGFRPEDLAAVGKLGNDDDECADICAASSTADKAKSAEVEKPLMEVKKERAKDLKKVKPMTKEEQDMEKERRLANREVELSGDFEPETQEDFARLLRKDPNSAEIWIRYVSFFLEKNDLTKARATAERALTVISYRDRMRFCLGVVIPDVPLISRFAQMEFRNGDVERGRTLFESVTELQSIDSPLSQQSAGVVAPQAASALGCCVTTQVQGLSTSTAAPSSTRRCQKVVIGPAPIQVPLPIQRVVARTIALPQTHRVQLLTVVQNPP
ncbi:hypothetical protein TELCIR_08613 [Teladorsagia circumcincta]|uniref:Tetratricopeptide repeat protein n=1 Tax=Teladorsagia circumcincta TaxID=45464 RepID=A0A2G9UH30_TELCI|nr:hypothetical protein TELCIR_08613 [Teladorsagia circumcincta]